MKPRNFLISFVVLLAGLVAGYFASLGAKVYLSELSGSLEVTDSYKIELPLGMADLDSSVSGASFAVFSNLYFSTREEYQEVINEGLLAVKEAIAWKDLVLETREIGSKNEEDFDRIITSMDYEIELVRILDYYRQFFMNYYRWIDTGESQSKTSYQLAMGQLMAVMEFHEEKYAKDNVAAGIDFEEARQGVVVSKNTGRSVRWARVVVVLSLFLLVLGVPGLVRDRANRRFAGTLYFDAIFRPSRVESHHVYHGTTRLSLLMVALYVLGLVIFSGFSSLLFPVIIGGLGLIYIILLAIFIHRGSNFRNILISLMAPKLLMMAFILLFIAVRGPIYFWSQMWVSNLFRVLFFSLFIMFLFRKFHSNVVLCRKWSGGKVAPSIAYIFTALGIQLLLAGLALQFFGLEHCLTSLNNDLLVLPRGLSENIGITTLLGIPMEITPWIIYFAWGLMALMLPLNHSVFQRIFKL